MSNIDLIEQLVIDLATTFTVHLLDSLADALRDMGSDTNDKAYATSLILTSSVPPCLLSIISNTVNPEKDRVLTNARVRGLKIIAEFLKSQKGESIGPHVQNTTLQCIYIFKHNDSNEIKAASLIVIRNILKLRLSNSIDGNSEYFKVADMLTLCMDSLQFDKQAKHTSSELFKVIGLLIACFPAAKESRAQADLIMKLCKSSLTNNFKNSSKEPDFPVIAGTFSCLDRCLLHFEGSLHLDERIEVFKYITLALSSVAHDDLKRFAIVSKALRLLANHASLFSPLISINASQVYELLILCRDSGKVVVAKHTDTAIASVLMEVSCGYVERHECGEFIKSLIKSCMTVLESGDAKESMILFTVKCISNISSALSASTEKTAILSTIMTSSERTSTSSTKLFFLYAIAKLLCSSESDVSALLPFLILTCKIVALEYPLMILRNQNLFAQTLSLLATGLVHDTRSTHAFIDDIVPFLFYRTICRIDEGDGPPLYQLLHPLTGGPEDRYFPYYVHLWSEVLVPTQKDTKVVLSARTLNYAECIASQINDSIIETLVKFMDRVDLSYKQSVEEGSHALVPANFADQELLINAASLIEDMMTRAGAQTIVSKWVVLVLERVIPTALEYPLVSALYRIMSVFIRSSGLQQTQSAYPQVRNLLANFIARLNSSLPYFDGELLDSCLAFVFIARPFLSFDELFPSLQMALSTNIRILPALETIEDNRGESGMVPHLVNLLPLFDTYLKSSSSSLTMSKRDKGLTSRRAKDTHLDKDVCTDVTRKVLRLLGRLGGLSQYILTNPIQTLRDKAAMCSTQLDIKVTTPAFHRTDLPEVKFDLARLTPRLIELALSDINKESQRLSAEMLHACVVFMIGTAASSVRGAANGMSSHYRDVFPAVLQLASTSSDLVCRELFKSLLLQCVRWFSGVGHVSEDEALALIDALIEGSHHGSDGSVARIAAGGLEEFFKWSLRQTTKTNMAASPGSAHSLLNRVFILCSHSSENKRAAAALLFSRIYLSFREESTLVHQFILKIITELLKSLRLPGGLSFKRTVFECCSRYVELVIKSVTQKDDKFGLLQNSIDRASPSSVLQLIESVFESISHPSCLFYRKCVRDIICRLAPITLPIHEPTPLKRFIVETFKAEVIISSFEGSEILDVNINGFSSAKILEWCRSLLAALDSYHWLFGISLEFTDIILSPPAVMASKKRKALTDKMTCTVSSSLLTSMKSFSVHIAQLTLSLRGSPEMREICTRIVDLLVHLVQIPAGLDTLISMQLWSSAFKEQLCVELLEAHRDVTGSRLIRTCCSHLFTGFASLESDGSISFPELICIGILQRLEVGVWCTLKPQVFLNMKDILPVIMKTNTLSTAAKITSGDLRTIGNRILNEVYSLSADEELRLVENGGHALSLCCTLGVSVSDLLHLLSSITNSDKEAFFARRYLTPVMIIDMFFGSNLDFSFFCHELECFLTSAYEPQASVNIDRFIEALLMALDSETPLNKVRMSAVLAALIRVSEVSRRHLKRLLELNARLAENRVPGVEDFGLSQVCSILKCKASTILELTEAISLVGFFIRGNCITALCVDDVDISVQERVIEALEELVAQRYPLNSQKLDHNSEQGRGYEVILTTHLDLISTCGAVILFDQLSPLLKEGETHRYYTKLCAAFSLLASTISQSASPHELNLAVQSIHKQSIEHSADMQMHPHGGKFSQPMRGALAVTSYCLQIIFSRDKHVNIRKFFYTSLLEPLMQVCSVDCLCHISCYVGVLFYGSVVETSTVKQLVDILTLCSQSVGRSWAYALLCIIYDRLELSVLKGSVTKAYAGEVATGKELTVAICKAATGELIKTNSSDYIVKSSAYSVLCIVVSKTQSEEKFYENFLFKTTPWRSLVDCTVEYNFESVAFETRLLGYYTTGPKTSTSLSRLSARGGYDPMLSQNALLNFSSVNHSQIEEVECEEDVVMGEELVSQDRDGVTGLDDVIISLELNHVNQQTIMGPLLRAIHRMGTLFEVTWKASGNPPNLVSHIIHHLCDTTNHRNVRLFFIRLILNQPACSLLKPFASSILPAMLRCCLIDLFDDVQTDINYFIKDIVFLLCEQWVEVTVDVTFLSQLAMFISKLLNMLERGVTGFKENTTCIMALINFILIKDLNHDKVELEMSAILLLMTSAYAATGGAHGRGDSKGSSSIQRRIAGLTLLIQMLISGYGLVNNPLFDELVAALLDCLLYPRKEVASLASKAIGILLPLVRERNYPKFTQFRNSVEAKLMTIISQKDGYDSSSSCILQISKGCTDFLSRDLFLRLMTGFSGLKSRGRLELLSALLISSSDFEGVSFISYLQPHIVSLLKDLFSHGKIQYTMLKLLNKNINDLTPPVVEILVRQTETDTGCLRLLTSIQAARETREEAFSLLMGLQRTGQRGFRRLLLLGLGDADTESMSSEHVAVDSLIRVGIRRRLLEYFNSELPQSFEARLDYLMQHVFFDTEGDDWLSCTAYLLLQVFRETRAYSAELFSKDLGSCAFQELQLSNLGQVAALHPMVPQFSFSKTQSLMSQTQRARWAGTQSVDHSQRGLNQVRGTQVYSKWTQTQIGSQLLSEEGLGSMAPPTTLPSRFNNKNIITQQTIGRIHSTPNIDMTQRIPQRKVIMYRQYREGELPDIRITVKDLLFPASGLALLDKSTAAEIIAVCFEETYSFLLANARVSDTSSLERNLTSMLSAPTSSGQLASTMLSMARIVVRLTHSANFSPNVLSTLGVSTLQYYAAIQVVEEQLICLEKHSNPDPDLIQNHWVALSILYSALGEEDVLLAVAARTTDSPGVRGLDAELTGDFKGAILTYNNADDNKLWDERSWNCLLQLNEWDQLFEKVTDMAADEVPLIGDTQYLDVLQLSEASRAQVMPTYLKCILHLGLDAEINLLAHRLFANDDRARDTRAWFEGSAAGITELAFLFAAKYDWPSVLKYASKGSEQFLEQWRSLHPLATEAKRVLLHQLQCLVELEDCALDPGSEGLVDTWRYSYPSLTDPLSLWSDVAYLRGLGMGRTATAAKHLVRFRENVCYAAVHRGALYTVKDELKACAVLRTDFQIVTDSAIRETEIVSVYNKQNLLKKTFNEQTRTGIFLSMDKTLELIEGKLALGKSEQALELSLLRSDWLRLCGDYKRTHGLGLEASKTALDAHLSLSKDCRDNARFQYSMAEYTVQLLTDKASDVSNVFDYSLLRRLFVQSVVSGLRLGEVRCRDLLLRVMDVLAEDEELQRVFINDHLDTIPSWMFIRYVSQLIPRLEQEDGPAVAAVLTNVALQYPFAVFYPHQITSAFFGHVGNQRAVALRKALQIPSLDCFIEALNGLSHPEMRWGDALSEITANLRSLSTTQLERKLDDLYTSCIEISWSHVGDKVGNYNKKFAKMWTKDIKMIFEGSEDAKSKLEALTLLTNKKGISRIDENGKLSCGKVPLVEFSTWLSEYDCCLHDVEIPGCYFFDLNKEPSVHDHPKIVSCVPELLVMASKRKPKRITFVGSNGKEYAFLCKGGEDLRNDERILSMFELMNVIVNRHVDVKTHADAYAIKSNVELHVKTYTVIPMTVTLGLLEWVHNSIPLKTAIETEMLFDKDFCQNNKEAIGYCNNKQVVDFNLLAAAQLQTKWLTSHSADSYHSMFKSKSLKAAITVFKLMQDQVPRDLLRRVLLKMSSSSAVFFVVRAEFAKSLAAASIYGYILGLGDRHLENIMLNSTSGSVIHIDFGICFGMGATHLPVPELIPFRLTPQLQSALMPLDGTGLLRQYMLKVLNRLQSTASVHILMNALDIYLNDPVVDWVKGSEKKSMGALEDEKYSSGWEPGRRIAHAKKKLNRISPVLLLKAELAINPRCIKSDTVRHLHKMLDPMLSRDATTLDTSLEISDQVDELIRLATDPDILARQWCGLATWI